MIPATSRTAEASTATTSFAVTATVVKACIVAATPIAFGVYNPVSASALNATGTLTVTCTATTPYQTGLSAGVATGASVTSRKMTGVVNTNLLPYGLYQDAAHAQNWGNTPGTDTPASVTGTGLPQLATVYGQIAPGTSGAIDVYTDTVTVTVTY
ncbi:Csu type fimbrial protein [Terriglobus roseus]|uniref:Csu type fimbrial protein n=1 Tax=Terriglobus roseus TaxID=392734 RepID=UPI001C25D06A|nr:spore coat U domain-containing protein [Terriglobus roseus]